MINFLKRRQISYMFYPIHVDMVATLQEASWEDTDSTKKKKKGTHGLSRGWEEWEETKIVWNVFLS